MQSGHVQASCNLIKFQDLPILWELQAENPSKLHSKEEQACESHYVKNTTRDNTNRYVVKLPFNDKKDFLGNSLNTALQRCYALERKFDMNPTFLFINPSTIFRMHPRLSAGRAYVITPKNFFFRESTITHS